MHIHLKERHLEAARLGELELHTEQSETRSFICRLSMAVGVQLLLTLR
jgi:hypothetical protein